MENEQRIKRVNASLTELVKVKAKVRDKIAELFKDVKPVRGQIYRSLGRKTGDYICYFPETRSMNGFYKGRPFNIEGDVQ